MSGKNNKFKFLLIGLFFLFSFSLVLNASVSLNDYPQIKSSWDDGELTSAIAQLQKEADKRSNNDDVTELLKKITFQKSKLDEWIGKARLLLKQQKFEEAKKILDFAKIINQNYSPYRNLVNKVKTTEEDLKYPSRIIFDGRSLANDWKVYEAHGGNFKKHTQFINNELTIDVPKENGWGKVGIASTKAMIDFTETNQSLSYRLKFDFDSMNTTDFVINLKNIDSWHSLSIVYKHLGDNKTAMIELWRDGKLNGKLNIDNIVPEYLRLVIDPNNRMYLYLPDGTYLQTTSLKYSLPKKGYRLEIYSQAGQKNLPVKMALKSVKLKKVPFSRIRISNINKNETILFDGKYLHTDWKPYEAHGGNFIEHTQFKNNELMVNVPKDNGWGKVGIASTKAVIDFRETNQSLSYRLKFDFDSMNTTDFVINLKSIDSWYSLSIAYKHLDDNKTAMIELWRDGKLNGKLKIDNIAPEYLRLVIDPNNRMYLYLPDGTYLQTTSLKYPLPKKGYRLEIYSQAEQKNLSTKMALKSIKLKQVPFSSSRISNINKNETILFDGKYLHTDWKPYAAHGGNSIEHAQFKNNEFMVNVPKENGWGKVGIASTKAMIDFTETNQSSSYRLKFDFDSMNTTDFVINLKSIDSWYSLSIVYKHLDDNKTAMIELWRDGKLNMQLETSIAVPKFLDLVIQPNNFVYLQLPDGRYLQTTSLKYTLPEKGYNLEVYSQAAKKDLQVKMALKSIILKKLSFKKYSDNDKAKDKIILYDGKFLDGKWVPHRAHGGNFMKHAMLKDHKLIVDVPKGNKWGKVGILSPNSLIWLDDFGKGAETQVTFKFDENQTDGFMLALVKPSYGGVRGNDPGNPRVAFLWNTITENNQSVMKLIIDNKEVWKEELNATVSPSYVTFKLEEGSITVSGDTFPAKSTKWHGIKANCGFRIWAYSHAYLVNKPVKMSLKQIILTKKAGKSDDPAPSKGVAPLVIKQLFNGKDNKQWESVGAAGGNFSKFGHFENGKMVVDVPKKNGWGKTGILSKEKFLKFNQRLKYIPYKVTVKVDPLNTTGFVVAFSGRKIADMWSSHRIWISLIQSSDGSYYLYLRGSYYHYWGRTINPEIMKNWDGTLEILFENKRTKVCVGGVCVAGPVGYGAFSSAFATILSHPAKEYGASKLTLEKVTGQWIAPDGMSTLDRWQFVDDEDFDPNEFLMELKGGK